MARGGFNGGGFGGMNQAQMMKQAQKMQQDLLKMQEDLENQSYEATSGGGAIKATVSGGREISKLEIDPEVVDPEDVEIDRKSVV